MEKLRPDVILTDISMPLLNGLDAIRQIRSHWPDAKIIVLTMHREASLAGEAFRAGASGYLLKISPGDELINAIREVAQGRSYVTTLLAKDLITLLLESGSPTRGDGIPLTPRQRILQLIAEGRTMKEVASILNISPRTAESHRNQSHAGDWRTDSCGTNPTCDSDEADRSGVTSLARLAQEK